MSDGPIKREREAWKPPKSIPIADRLHARSDNPKRAYCGTSDRPEYAPNPTTVTCPNCQAAIRADEETS